MASKDLLDWEDADSSPRSSPNTFTHSFSSTAIELKALKPSVGDVCGCEALLHTTRLSLGLHVPKQYLIIAQQADAGDADVYLRIPISLDNIIYTLYCEEDRTTLVLEVRSRVQYEVVYSDQTGSQLEKDLEQEIVQATCSLSTTDLEIGTKLAINAKAKENEEDFHVIIQTMASVLEGGNRGHHFDDRDRPADIHHNLNDLITPNLTDAASPDGELVDSPEDHQHQTQLDIWEGLEQLEFENIRKRITLPDMSDIQASTSDTNKVEDSIGLGIDFGHAPPPVQTSNTGGDGSTLLTPAEEQFESFDSMSGEISFPSTQEISTIQSLPSAAFPQMQTLAVYKLVERVTPGSLQGQRAEQQLQQQWETITGQWSSAQKASKYANIKTNYTSGPRISEDVNHPRESRGGQMDKAASEKNNENVTPAAGRHETTGWGYGTFGQPRGRGRGGRAGAGGGRAGGVGRGTRSRGRSWGRGAAGVETMDLIKSFRGSWGDDEENKVW